MPIYGPWVQDPDSTGGTVEAWRTRAGLFFDSATLWADAFPGGIVYSGSASVGPANAYAGILGGVGSGGGADWSYDVIAIDVIPSTAVPDPGYTEGPAGTPPAGSTGWEFHPDDPAIEILTYDVTFEVDAAAGLDTRAWVRVMAGSEYVYAPSTHTLTSLTIPDRTGLAPSTAAASGTLTGDPTVPYNPGPTFTPFVASATVTGYPLAGLQPLVILAGVDMFADGDTPPPGPDPDTGLGGGFGVRGGGGVSVGTFRPRRWRWIYEGVTLSPPLHARQRLGGDVAGTPPLHVRGRDTRQERLYARGPL
jgi:hypothetical protein